MCNKIAIVAIKEELQEYFNDYLSLIEFEPIDNGTPLQKLPVFTDNRLELLKWGDKNDKLTIHHSKHTLDFDKFKRGVLAVTGFYIIKKEKAPAPIGFGDHKETVKITSYFVKRKNDSLIVIPVVISNKTNSFYILMQDSKKVLGEYQKKEPVLLNDNKEWLENSSLITNDILLSEFEISKIN